MLRTVSRWTVGALAVGLLAACGGPSSGRDEPSTQPSAASATPTPSTAARPDVVVITSDDVPMPPPADGGFAASAPSRVVSLASGVGETIAALGGADRLVGRDETSSVPEIASAPVVTKAHATSPERVLALDPDLVIVDEATSPPEAVDQIEAAGVPVVRVPQAWTLADIGPRTQAVAAAVGASPEAAAAVIAEAADRASRPPSGDGPRVAFLYLRGTSAVYLLGGAGSGADALIAAAGGTDAGAQAGYGAFVPLTAEALAALDPDVLLVMAKGLESVGGVDGLVQLPGVAQTRAGRERRVVAVDDTLLLSFGPRTGVLVDALADALATAGAR